MSGVYKLLEHFPNCSFAQSNIDSYNNELIQEIERIRDFHCPALPGRARRYAVVGGHMASEHETALDSACFQRIELYKRTGPVFDPRSASYSRT